ELRYEGSSDPPLRALDKLGHVLYVNSFSKLLLPGIRVGYVTALAGLRDRLVTIKQAADLFTSSLMQRALTDYLESGHLDAHLATVHRVYRERRDAMLAGLARYMPAEARWTNPDGGLCLWLTLPPSVSAAQLYLTAIDRGVAFAVGSVFFPEDPAPSALRLNFAAHPTARIEEGLRRLGRAVREHVGRSAASPRQQGLKHTREPMLATDKSKG
ncbi:MAG: PLP-dependent aminotransferase family protein, partial [Anaerolineae bacterium]